MRGLQIAAGAAIVVVVLALAGWRILSPGWAVAEAQQQVQNQLGRNLDVGGGASLEFSPRLAIRLNQAHLAGPAGQESSFITARAIRVPISFGQLIAHRLDASSIELDGAEFALLIGDRGHASWGFAAVKTPAPVAISVEHGSMRFFDARTGQSFTLSAVRGNIDIGIAGDVTVKATADMGGRLARIDAYVKSLARIHEDGSPLDLSIETPDASATFNGRIATAKILNLAGPVTIESPNLRAAAHWAGLAVDEGNGYGALSVSGALDSAGRAFAIHRAAINLDKAAMAGELVVDLRGAVPKLQAALRANRLALDPFLPESGRRSDQWGNLPLGFETLKAFDAEVTIDATSLGLGSLALGPGRMVLTLAKGRLEAALALPSFASGSLQATAVIAGAAIPPTVSVAVKAVALDAGAIVPGLTGAASVNAALTGFGRTELELAGTLKGTGSVVVADGEIRGPDLTAMLAAVSQRILEGWTDKISGTTPFTSLNFAFTVADGIATLKDASLDTPTLKLTASGAVDLLRRAIDLKADPKLVTGQGKTAAFPVSIIARGLWGMPRIYPDLAEVLTNPKAAFDKLKAMGLPASN